MVLADSDDEDEEPRARARRLGARYRADMDREVSRMKVKLAEKVNSLSRSWTSAKTVRTREKICEWQQEGCSGSGVRRAARRAPGIGY
jgi:hypothetical protein